MKTSALGNLGGRYSAIFVAVLSSAIFEPLVRRPNEVPWGLWLLLFFVVFGSLRAVWSDRRLLWLVAALSFVALVAEVRESVTHSAWGPVALNTLGILTLALVCYGILADIFTRDEITADTVFGAAAVYVMVGLLFARAYVLIEVLHPSAFAFTPALASESAGWQMAGLLHYFSLITLTTVGYGDVTPVAPLARNLSAVEAVIAQLYVAAVIARLVALYTANAEARKRRGGGHSH